MQKAHCKGSPEVKTISSLAEPSLLKYMRVHLQICVWSERWEVMVPVIVEETEASDA